MMKVYNIKMNRNTENPFKITTSVGPENIWSFAHISSFWFYLILTGFERFVSIQ